MDAAPRQGRAGRRPVTGPTGPRALPFRVIRLRSRMARREPLPAGRCRKPPELRIPVRTVLLAVLGLTVVVAAFLASYAIALGNPSPRHLPVAVSAPPAVLRELGASPQLRVYSVPDPAGARTMVEDRAAYGALVLPRNGPATVLVANGGGHSVEAILVQLGQQLARTRGTTLTTVDVAPTSPNDPNGTGRVLLHRVPLSRRLDWGGGAGQADRARCAVCAVRWRAWDS